MPTIDKDSIITPSRDVQELNAGGPTVAPANVLEALTSRYPALIAVISMMVGIAVSLHCPPWMWFVAVALIVGSLLSALWAGARRLMGATYISLMCLFVALGMLSALGLTFRTSGLEPPPSKVIVRATVEKTIASGPGFRVLLLSSGLIPANGIRLPGLGRLYLRDETTRLCAGDRIAFRCFLRTPRNRGNPGEFDWELHCKSEGIAWLASAHGEGAILLLRRGNPYTPSALLFSLRESMARFLEEHSSGNVRAVLKGVILGDRGELDHQLRREFSDSGLLHILSASGLHVGMVAGLIGVMVGIIVRFSPSILLWVPFKKLAAVTAVPAIVAYCLLVGARIPSVRATIMGVVFAAALALDRRWHSLNTLALAGLIVLFSYPLSLFTLGFQLSFAAVCGIMILVPPVIEHLYGTRRGRAGSAGAVGTGARTARREGFAPGEVGEDRLDREPRSGLWRRTRPVAGLVLVGLAAQIAVTPFILRAFHVTPVLGPVANLVAVPLLLLALPFGLTASLVGVVWPAAGNVLLMPAEFPVQGIVAAASFFGRGSSSLALFPGMDTAGFVCALITVGVIFLTARRYSRLRLIAACCMAVLTWGILTIDRSGDRSDRLHITFLNVGKADAALVRMPDSTTILIDAGTRNRYFDAGNSIIVPYLRWCGIVSLEDFIVSHPQMDHIGGILSTMNWVMPARIRMNPVGVRSEFERRVYRRLLDAGGRIVRGDRTCDPVRFGRVMISFLNPPAQALSHETSGDGVNNASLVCRIDYGDVSILFTGDIEEQAEAELVRSGLLKPVTILKVPHHGCKSSSSMPFLRAVRPDVGVISCFERPFASCPYFEVMLGLRSLGTEVFWTGRDGAVLVSTDGDALQVTTGKSNRIRTWGPVEEVSVKQTGDVEASRRNELFMRPEHGFISG